MKSISIVVPCFNEALGIGNFCEEVNKLIISLPVYDFEVIFVDDGSSDKSFECFSSLAGRYAWLKGIGLTRNFGKEAAMTAGLDQASGDAIIFMDADLQHPPVIVKAFLERWECGSSVVVGQRIDRDTDSRVYRFMAKIFYALHNTLSDIKLPHNVGDFRLLDRRVADQLKLLGESRRFMKGLFAWVGYEPDYVAYSVAPRLTGRTSFNKWRSWNFALEGITSFSTAPLRVWTYLGLLILLVGIIYSVFIVVGAIVHGVSAPGYVTLLTAVVIFGGIQLIGIGILGEYIGRIYVEVKNRPVYLIERFVRN